MNYKEVKEHLKTSKDFLTSAKNFVDYQGDSRIMLAVISIAESLFVLSSIVSDVEFEDEKRDIELRERWNKEEENKGDYLPEDLASVGERR